MQSVANEPRGTHYHEDGTIIVTESEEELLN
jgi:hypothetical protein